MQPSLRGLDDDAANEILDADARPEGGEHRRAAGRRAALAPCRLADDELLIELQAAVAERAEDHRHRHQLRHARRRHAGIGVLLEKDGAGLDIEENGLPGLGLVALGAGRRTKAARQAEMPRTPAARGRAGRDAGMANVDAIIDAPSPALALGPSRRSGPKSIARLAGRGTSGRAGLSSREKRRMRRKARACRRRRAPSSASTVLTRTMRSALPSRDVLGNGHLAEVRQAGSDALGIGGVGERPDLDRLRRGKRTGRLEGGLGIARRHGGRRGLRRREAIGLRLRVGRREARLEDQRRDRIGERPRATVPCRMPCLRRRRQSRSSAASWCPG